MKIPTEPIGSIPRPPWLLDAIAERDGADPFLDGLYEEAVRDTIERFEATGSPVITDGEQARQIREQPGGTGVMLVALTGWGQDEDRRRSREAGFDHHMTKPVELADLQKLLADTLPSHSRRHQATR
jgi:methionine synthase II (cobalamin-independent)